MSAFDRLHPHLRHAIVHDLGWRSLRPVQDLATDAILDGCNAVVLAPTAGGKTEAALFPTLSRILTEEHRPVAALYLCPIRALLNNQEARLQAYARMVGLDAFKWHGDVSDSQKSRFRGTPAHILMTTPESLEVMLMSPKTDARSLFAGLQLVIIDEVHAFAGDDRGAHLAALLERLTRFCGRDIQRVGLSATVGNPEVIGEWLRGSSSRPFRLVDPSRNVGPAVRDVRVDFGDDLDLASGIIAVARGKKSLVFVESRARAERVGLALGGTGVEVFVHHSAVSRADRTLAEAQFATGHNTAIVCTSTLELGIDVGDLDHVIQVDAPSSVASYLQRIGRTGRRPGARANCAFFCSTPESLLQTVAILRLAARGEVEDVRPGARVMHVLAHQVLAVILQEGGISRHRIREWFERAYPFSEATPGDLASLVETMLARDLLYESDGVLSLGAAGEKQYGRRNFFELYAVFSAPPVLRVVHGRAEVGTLQASFVWLHDPAKGPLCFRLSGRAWQAGEVEWGKGILHVHPADRGVVPAWLGVPSVLPRALCQSMAEVLRSPGGEGEWLTTAASAELDALRADYDGLVDPEKPVLESTDDGVTWHTFAGGGANRLLAAGLEEATRRRWLHGNLSVRCRDLDLGLVEARAATKSLCDLDELALRVAGDLSRGLVSKFQPCLPDADSRRLLVDRLLDVAGAKRVLAGGSM